MANKIRIEVEDATKAGLDSVVANADKVAAELASKPIVANVELKIDDAEAKSKIAAAGGTTSTASVKLDVEGITGQSLVDDKLIAKSTQQAEQAIDHLRERTELLLAAFHELSANGLGNIGEKDVAKLAKIGAELEQTQQQALRFAATLREMGDVGGERIKPLAGFGEAIEAEVQQSAAAMELLEGKFAEVTKTAQAESAKQVQDAEATASIIAQVRREQAAKLGQTADQQAEAVARAFVAEQQAAEKTAGIIATVRAEQEAAAGKNSVINELNKDVKEFQGTLTKAAEAANKLSREIETTDFPDDQINEVRALAAQIDKTRQATEMAADAFDMMGQTDAAARLRMGLAETAGSAKRLKDSLNALEVRKLQNEMTAAGNSAQHMSGGLDASGQAAKRLRAALADMGIPKLTAEMNRVEAAARGAAGNRSASGQGILQLAYAADDLQYGMRGIVNNIPILLTSLGAGAGLAGVVAIAAVAINVLLPKIEQLGEALAKDGFAKTAAKGVEELTDRYRKLEVAMNETINLTATEAAGENRQANIDRLKKEIAEYKRLGDVKAAQKAIGDGLLENQKKAADRQSEDDFKALDSAAKLEARLKSLREVQQLQATGEAAPSSIEDNQKLMEQIGKLEGALHSLREAEKKKNEEQRKSDSSAEYARQESALHSQLKTLDQVHERRLEIAKLIKGSATGEAGYADLSVEAKKRLHDEDQKLLASEHALRQATAARLQENQQLTKDATEKLADQSAELSKQAKLTRELQDLEARRAAVQSGMDDPKAESDRQASEARRGAFLDRVKSKTAEARKESEKANAAQNLSETEKQAKRAAYAAAVQSQITAESNLRKQADAERAAREYEQASKIAVIDQDTVQVRRDAVAAANAEAERARIADDVADRDRSAGSDERRKKATADLAKARAEQLRAEADLQKQIETNEANRKATFRKNLDDHTKKRIADEIEVGKAREAAMLAADQVERDLEAAKKARHLAALKQDPRVQQVAGGINQRIKERDVEKRAMQQRQNEAEAKFRRERQKQGRKVKGGDVAKVRGEAAKQFIQDKKKGRAGGELADARDAMFREMVDGARGLSEEVAAALKAASAEAARLIREKAAVDRDVEKAEKAKPGDKAAKKKAANEAERKKDDQANKDQRAANRDNREDELNDPLAMPQIVMPRKTIEQIRAEEKIKGDKAREAREKFKADREAKQKAEAEKKQREQQKKDDVVAANVADVEERRARENETPEQKIAREQKEDDAFRKQREDEADAAAMRDFQKMEANKPKPNREQKEAEFRRRKSEAIKKADADEAAREADQPTVAEPPQIQDNQQANTQAVAAVNSALKQMADSQTKADASVVDALNAVAQMLTDQAKGQVQLQDVVAQVTAHVNEVQQQFIAQSNTAKMLSQRGATV